MTTGVDPLSKTPLPPSSSGPPSTPGGASRTPSIYLDEPGRKPAPVLEVGALAWIRNNLFRTWFDTLLTVAASVFAVSTVVGLLRWVFVEANWYAIIFNLRLLMVGRFEQEYEWRAQLALLLFAFVGGFTLAAFSRLTRTALVLIAVVVLMVFALPPIINATIALPSTYLAAGNVEIASGSATEAAQPQLAFFGLQGEEIRIDVASDLSGDDAALADMHGFGDVAANTLRAGAEGRLNLQEQRETLELRLSGDALTTNQREQFTAELERIQIPEAFTDTYSVNQVPVLVRVLNGESGDVLAEGVVEQGGNPLLLTLPEDGWFIIEKTPAEGGGEGVTLLETQGIYPVIQRDTTRLIDDENTASGTRRESVTEFIRFSDMVMTEADRPSGENGDVPIVQIVDVRYRGDTLFPHYLRLYVSLFFRLIDVAVLLIVIAVGVGYIASLLVERFFPDVEQPRGRPQRWAVWMLFAAPVVAFIILYGIGGPLPFTDTQRWGGLLLTIFLSISGIVLSFPLGLLLALGRRSSLPVISQFSTLYIEFVRGVPLITVLFMSQLLVPLVSPALAEVPNIIRAMIGIILFSAAYLAENVRGGLQSVPRGQIEAAKALSLSQAQISLFITLPQALRAVIPALVGQFISLFKDTSLVAIVGLSDLLGIAQIIYAQVEFIGLRREVLLFVALIYFVFCYSMGAVSRQIERTGSGVMRRQQI